MTDLTREGLVELATKAEQASGPDDALAMAIAEFDYHSNGGLALGVNYDPRLWMERNGIDPTSSLDAARKIWNRWDHAEVYRPDHETLGWTVHLFENANVSRYQHTGFAATEELAWLAAALYARAMEAGHG